MRDQTPSVRAFDQLISDVYERLRKLAASFQWDAHVTLNATALANEAYMRLAKSPELAVKDRDEFIRIAGGAMRQCLADSARRKGAEKKGRDIVFVSQEAGIDGAANNSRLSAEDFLTIHRALDELESARPRLARIVECKFFFGFTDPETAAYLDISRATVERDWASSKAWLAAKLRA
jgi:RNA polymerase sigma factor (TIGR02999 family)